MTILVWVLLVLACVTGFGAAVAAAEAGRSDPATKGLTALLAMALVILLWLLLAAVLIIAAVRGEMPVWERWAAAILVPASCAGGMAAVSLMTDPRRRWRRWPLAVLVIAPLLVMGAATGSYFSSVRGAMPAWAGMAVWGAVAMLGAALVVRAIGRQSRP